MSSPAVVLGGSGRWRPGRVRAGRRGPIWGAETVKQEQSKPLPCGNRKYFPGTIQFLVEMRNLFSAAELECSTIFWFVVVVLVNIEEL